MGKVLKEYFLLKKMIILIGTSYKRYLTKFYERMWRALGEKKDVRAQYLFNMFSKNINVKPKRYLEIGAQHCANTLVFGRLAKEALALDLYYSRKVTADKAIRRSIFLIIADGAYLPFRNEAFDMVSQFSVLEHISNMRLAIEEAFRVLQKNGIALMQIPNRYFPIEPHCGLPLVNFIPSPIRRTLFKMLACEFMLVIDIPSLRKLISVVKRSAPRAEIAVQKTIYPPSVLFPPLREIAKLACRLHVFDIIPFGYLLTIKK